MKKLLLFASLLLGACTSADVTVSPPVQPNSASAVSYQLENKSRRGAEEALPHREAARRVRTALASRGMYEAPSGTKPDVIIELELGVSPPTKKWERRSEREHTEIPGQIRTETRFLGTDSSGAPMIEYRSVQDGPRQVFLGTQFYEIAIPIYQKRLRLTARQNPATPDISPAEIWSVEVTSEGRSRNFGSNLPKMVAATLDSIGKDARGPKTVKLAD